MADLRLSNRASDEIYQEAERLELLSPAKARAFVAALAATVERLRQFPELGRKVPEYDDPSIREFLHQNYRIFYALTDDGNRVNITSVQSSRYPHQKL